MSKNVTGGLGGRVAAGIAAVALVIAIPSSGLALGLLHQDSTFADTESFASFTPASIDPGLARIVAERSGDKARMMRFTPAGVTNREQRAVTVAVRVDQETARAMFVRSKIDPVRDQSVAAAGVRIAPTRYNLGISRGYQSFAKPPALSAALSDANIPNLQDFVPSAGAADKPSRFAARIELGEEMAAGRAPRTIQSTGDQTLDVGGSYRLTRNLDFTAGVRYSQERDRLAPLPDIDAQDSQAVYVGTQFRF